MVETKICKHLIKYCLQPVGVDDSLDSGDDGGLGSFSLIFLLQLQEKNLLRASNS